MERWTTNEGAAQGACLPSRGGERPVRPLVSGGLEKAGTPVWTGARCIPPASQAPGCGWQWRLLTQWWNFPGHPWSWDLALEAGKREWERSFPVGHQLPVLPALWVCVPMWMHSGTRAAWW